MQHFADARQLVTLAEYNGRWGQFYTNLKTLRHTPPMENCHRVWSLASALADVMETIWDVPCQGAPVRSFFEPEAPLDNEPDRQWITASRCFRPEERDFNGGNRLTRERRLRLPQHGVAFIYISLVDLFGRRYVSGLRLVDRDGASHHLGYRHPTSELLLLASGDGLCDLRGFLLAQDQRGIRGIAAIIDSSINSKWVGDYNNIPKRRLVLESEPVRWNLKITDLQGKFDISIFSLSCSPMCLSFFESTKVDIFC
jgi:hypothetical protein